MTGVDLNFILQIVQIVAIFQWILIVLEGNLAEINYSTGGFRRN